MKQSSFALLALIYLAIVFGIAVFWEYYLEQLIVPFFDADHPIESTAERLEHVLTTSIFAMIALIVPAFVIYRGYQTVNAEKGTEARLVSILQATPDMVSIYTRDGMSIFFNRAAREMWGITENEDISGIRMIECYSPAAREAIAQTAIPTAIEKGLWVGESEVMGRSNTAIPVTEVMIAHKNAKGDVEFLSTIWRDATAQKQIERMKSDFVSIVSHELRTPLTSIRSSLNIVINETGDDLPEDAREMLHIADANTNRLVRLVNDILDLEKLEYDRLELHTEPIDSTMLVATTLAELSPMAKQAGVPLSQETETEIVVEGDRDRLVQVLTNLVGNAVKFSDSGSEVCVRVERMSGDQVRFSVQDHGPGIHWDNLPKLFGKFQQFGTGPEELVKKGTGLGLAISKAIIEHHGGRIGVESELGKGSVFYFELPLTQPAAKPDTGEFTGE